jgi:hypothetical protein
MRLFPLFLAFFGLAANAFSSNVIGELDSFPRVLLAGNGRHTTTLRYYDTRLAKLSPGGKYTAFLCQNNRVEISICFLHAALGCHGTSAAPTALNGLGNAPLASAEPFFLTLFLFSSTSR